MSDIVAVVKEWMTQHNFAPESLQLGESGQEGRLQYTTVGQEGSYDAFLDFDLGRQWVNLFVYVSIRVPERRRAAVADLLNRINLTLHLSNLEVTTDAGRLRWRTGVDIEGSALVCKMLDNMDGLGCHTLDRYFAVVMAVAFGDVLPERAWLEHTQSGAADPIHPRWTPSTEPPPWERFAGTGCLRRWGTELRDAVQQKADVTQWLLVGHGALVQCSNPGTGYKLLHRLAADAGLNFLHVPAASVPSLPLSGQSNPFRALAPALVSLEAGHWMDDCENADAQRNGAAASFRQGLLEQLNAFDPQRPVLFVVALESLSDIDRELCCQGGFDRRFKLTHIPHGLLGQEFIEAIGREHCAPSLLNAPAKVGRLLAMHDSDRARGLQSIALKRLALRERRQVEFVDLVNISTRGSAESDAAEQDDEPVRRQTAVHEAGHVVVAIIDSQGRNVPEYSTIVASDAFKGVVVESISHLHALDAQSTYRDFVHDVRVSLGGRAAEHLCMGAGQISSGSSQDLENATRHCGRAFATWGYAPGMDRNDNAGSNLAVVVDGTSASECAHLEALTRQFLADEYAQVLELLNTHRALLLAIADRLMWDTIVDQTELLTICQSLNIPLTQPPNLDMPSSTASGVQD